MNDAERWINGEGPPPPQIREMLEAARERPVPQPKPWTPSEWTPELAEELGRLVHAGIAAQEAKWARERRMKVGLAVAALAAAALGALVLVLRVAAPVAGSLVKEAAPSAIVMAAAEPEGTESTAATATVAPVSPAAPSVSASARLPDTGAMRPPGKHLRSPR